MKKLFFQFYMVLKVDIDNVMREFWRHVALALVTHRSAKG